MITLEQALTASEFHENGCVEVRGPRGGSTIFRYVWRRNGRTQTWKTRPGEFRIPVKFGLRTYDAIRNLDGVRFHVPEDCPLNQTGGIS